MKQGQEATKIQEMVQELKVADVMTRKLVTVEPKVPMKKLRSLLRVNRISGLPVVDGQKLVGIISLEDFIKALADRKNHCFIEEKMTKEVETLYEDERLVVAIDKFEISGLGRFPVIQRDTGKLVGILTKGDVIKGLLKKLELEHLQEEIHRYRASHIFEDIEADSTSLSFQYEVKGRNFKKAGEASSRLKRTLSRLGIRPNIVRRVAIASYEAEMNLAIFTEGGQICARVEPSRVVLEVVDGGPGIADVEKALQPGYSTASDWVRELGFGAGMGLPNMKRMSDTFEIDSKEGKGTHLKMVFLTREARDEAR